MPTLRIWCNMSFPPSAHQLLLDGTTSHDLRLSPTLQSSNLTPGQSDPQLAESDIAFGQPNPDEIIHLPRLKWVHLTSAGYERYDRPDLRSAFTSRNAALTTSSAVYSEPCAEHALAMMLCLARRLHDSFENQLLGPSWPAARIRADSRLLVGQTAVILGYGAIARRLIELLTPFHMNLIAIRRDVKGDEPIRTLPQSETDSVLPLADHLINTLPGGAATQTFLTRHRLCLLKPTAILYNIGRGGTLDQDALIEALDQKKLAAAYLDVMIPEPLPPDHPLWKLSNCHITPHTAGGHHDEHLRLVQHFLDNLHRFAANQSLTDRVI